MYKQRDIPQIILPMIGGNGEDWSVLPDHLLRPGERGEFRSLDIHLDKTYRNIVEHQVQRNALNFIIAAANLRCRAVAYIHYDVGIGFTRREWVDRNSPANLGRHKFHSIEELRIICGVGLKSDHALK